MSAPHPSPENGRAAELFDHVVEGVQALERLGYRRAELFAWKLYPSHPCHTMACTTGGLALSDGARLLVAPIEALLAVVHETDCELAEVLGRVPKDPAAVWFAVGNVERGRVVHAVRAIPLPPSTVKIPEA